VGIPRLELVGRSFAELVDAGSAAAEVTALLRDAFSGEQSRTSLKYPAADGSVRQGSVIVSPIFDGGVLTGALGIMRDVTEERRLTEQVIQQEKLVAVGQLVSGIAHELNNPLAGVLAFSQLLLASEDGQRPETRSAVETIHREAKRAGKIVNNLLTFARQQPGERVAVSLNRIVEDSLGLRGYALRAASVHVALELDPALPETRGDPSQLQQVVLNLLGNAEQALLERHGPRALVVRTWREGGMLLLSVSDNGPGIASAHRDRVFNPFFTTKPVGQGTGLGLSISDGIVREHGGSIRVDSDPGRGATFIVELPYNPPVRSAELPAEAVPSAATGGRRVLVVDDEPALRAAMKSFLSSLGHTVAVANSGGEAGAILRKNEYDVVLLDLRMADGGGDSLYRELLDRDPRQAARVVFVTGDMQGDAAYRFLAEAGRPVLSKPFQLDDLAAVVAAVKD
nr:response regulator [Gemmatimonadaceae bacterium]